MEPLTGRAAAEALALYSRLGAAGASFDSRRVGAAVHSTAGRIRLRIALSRTVRFTLAPPVRRARPRRLAVARRPALAAAIGSPGRPSRPDMRGG